MQRLALLILVALVTAPIVVLADKGDESMDRYAKQQYDRALELFSAGKYREASDAFHRAYKLDDRVEILFGWAQSKRLSGDCKGAVKLFKKLLRKGLPEADEKAVVEGMKACGVAAKVGSRTEAAEEAEEEDEEVEEEVEQEEESKPVKKERVEPVKRAEPPKEEVKAPPKPRPSVNASTDNSPWYSDIIGDALLVTGVVGLGVGTGYFLVSSSDRSAADEATNYESYTTLADRASTRRTIAIVTTTASAALITGAIVRFVMRDKGVETAAMATAWGSSDGAGFAVGGRF